jgi:predicted transposase YdaD
MLESPFYREILEEGKAIGLELGQEERLREDVLEALEVRFEIVPPDLEKQVRQIQGKKTLEGLLRRAILTESLEAFREDVSKVQ